MLKKATAILFTISSLTLGGLMLVACDDGPGHPEGIGNACDEDSDCPTQNCYLGPGGGYCTASCEDEGSSCTDISNSDLKGCEPNPS